MHAVEEKRSRRARVALEDGDEARRIERTFDNAQRVPRPREADQLQLAVVLIRPEERNRRVRRRLARRREERLRGGISLCDRVVPMLDANPAVTWVQPARDVARGGDVFGAECRTARVAR